MGVVAEAKKAEAKDLPILQPDKKENSLLRPGTVASADCVRPSIILQTLTKNVHEWLKRKGKKVKRS